MYYETFCLTWIYIKKKKRKKKNSLRTLWILQYLKWLPAFMLSFNHYGCFQTILSDWLFQMAVLIFFLNCLDMVSRQKDAYTKAVLVIPACMIILTGNIHLLPEKKTNKQT